MFIAPDIAQCYMYLFSTTTHKPYVEILTSMINYPIIITEQSFKADLIKPFVVFGSTS